MVGLLLGLVAALPFAAAEAAGALARRGRASVARAARGRADARGPLAEAYALFALALFAAADGPRLVAVAAGQSYLAWPIGQRPSAAQIVALGAHAGGDGGRRWPRRRWRRCSWPSCC